MITRMLKKSVIGKKRKKLLATAGVLKYTAFGDLDFVEQMLRKKSRKS